MEPVVETERSTGKSKELLQPVRVKTFGRAGIPLRGNTACSFRQTNLPMNSLEGQGRHGAAAHSGMAKASEFVGGLAVACQSVSVLRLSLRRVES